MIKYKKIIYKKNKKMFAVIYFFSIVWVFFFLLYLISENNRIKNEFEYQKELSKIFFKSINRFNELSKRDINEKWFSIFELPTYKKIEFFQNIKKKLNWNIAEFIHCIFMVFYVFILFIAIIYYFNVFLILFIMFLWIFFKENKHYISSFFLFFWKRSLENISWIKSDFLIIFENEVLLDGKKFSIKSWDLTSNRELMEFLQKNENLEFYDFKYFFKMEKIINLVNKKYRIINNFQKNIKILDEKLENLENISKSLEKNISENEEFFHKSSEILKNFKILDKKIFEIFNLKKNILENFEKITNDKNLDLKKFDFYVLEKVLNPILKLKNILQKNFENIEKMLLESKIEENHQIKFAEKRLEITKNNLQKQIIFLDEKLKFFEK